MRKLGILLAVMALCVSAKTLSAHRADVTGKWDISAKITMGPETSDEKGWFELKQDGSAVTGTFTPIDKGTPGEAVKLVDGKIDEEVRVAVGGLVALAGVVEADRNLGADAFGGAMPVAQPFADPARGE